MLRLATTFRRPLLGRNLLLKPKFVVQLRPYIQPNPRKSSSRSDWVDNPNDVALGLASRFSKNELSFDALLKEVSSSPPVFGRVIRSLAKPAEHTLAAYQLFKIYQGQEPVDRRLGNLLLMNLCRIGKIQEAEELYEFLKGNEPDERTFTILVNTYSRSGEKQKVQKVIDDREAFKIPDTQFWSESLLNHYIRHSTPQVALQYFEYMRTKGLITHIGYALVINVCQSYQWEQLCDPLSEPVDVLLSEDQATWYRKKRQADKCIELYDEMKGKDIIPSRETYNDLLFVCANSISHKRSLLSVWQELCATKEGPDVASFTTMIIYYGKECDFEMALYYWYQLIDSGIKPDTVLMNSFITMHCKHDSSKVPDLFIEMKQHGIRPDRQTYDALLSTFCVHQVDETLAHQYFQEMKDLGLASVYSYNSYITLNKNIETAENLLREMTEQGLYPTAETYCCCLRICKDQQNYEKAQQFWDQLKKARVTPSLGAYEVMIDIFHEVDRVKTMNLYEELQNTQEARKNRPRSDKTNTL